MSSAFLFYGCGFRGSVKFRVGCCCMVHLLHCIAASVLNIEGKTMGKNGFKDGVRIVHGLVMDAGKDPLSGSNDEGEAPYEEFKKAVQVPMLDKTSMGLAVKAIIVVLLPLMDLVISHA
ncbi:hypothetical protein Tco_0415504 [Tanacetum coccineum]